MLQSIIHPAGNFADDLALRGYGAVYRAGSVNHCPGCGRTHWYVGRLMAECGFCATALPLKDTLEVGSAAVHTHKNRPVFPTYAS